MYGSAPQQTPLPSLAPIHKRTQGQQLPYQSISLDVQTTQRMFSLESSGVHGESDGKRERQTWREERDAEAFG